MAFYRASFPGKVLPKHHFLEKHVVPWIKDWQFGLGLLGEQGGEYIHATFNRLGTIFKGVRNRELRLLSMMREHHTNIAPPPPHQKSYRSSQEKVSKEENLVTLCLIIEDQRHACFDDLVL